MRKKIVIANWKMHFTVGQASLFLHKLQLAAPAHRDVEAVLCPPVMALQTLSLQVNRHKFKLGAQNCYWQDEGAFTGEVSAAQLRGLADYVIVGHSERRHVFGERDADIAKKVQAVLRNGLQPVLCVGETKQERADGETAQVLHDQVVTGLANITSDEIERVVIAYEPVWAISTSANAEFAAVDDMVKAVNHIRRQLKALFGEHAAQEARVLYGGSVDSSTAKLYLNAPGIDGVLVGGASLKAPVFSQIISDAHASVQRSGQAVMQDVRG